jgi:hypothetical protein
MYGQNSHVVPARLIHHGVPPHVEHAHRINMRIMKTVLYVLIAHLKLFNLYLVLLCESKKREISFIHYLIATSVVAQFHGRVSSLITWNDRCTFCIGFQYMAQPANRTLRHCLACPNIGATCSAGRIVSEKGWWLYLNNNTGSVSFRLFLFFSMLNTTT